MTTMLAITAGEQWLTGSTVVMAILAFMAFFFPRKQEVKLKPPPLRDGDTIKFESKGRRFSAAMCDVTHATLDKQFSELEQFTKLEVDRLHDKIDLVDRRHGDKLEMALNNIHAQIGALPEKIIKLLEATGQLVNHRKNNPS